MVAQQLSNAALLRPIDSVLSSKYFTNFLYLYRIFDSQRADLIQLVKGGVMPPFFILFK